jgi:hypothetical protein
MGISLYWRIGIIGVDYQHLYRHRITSHNLIGIRFHDTGQGIRVKHIRAPVGKRISSFPFFSANRVVTPIGNTLLVNFSISGFPFQ